jgi:glyoxylase-like metal-dependent hydrolase (beta-lactamase superfamily II)
MELAAGVHRIEIELGPRIVYLYLFVGDVTVLLDTGPSWAPESVLRSYMSEIGMDLRDITIAINTHCDADHFGGNASMKALSPKTLLIAHESDRSQIENPEITMIRRYLQFEPEHGITLPDDVKADLYKMMGRGTNLDILFKGGEEVRISSERRLQVLHAPGHSDGHIAFFDHYDRTLYIGDAVLWRYIPDRKGRPALPPSYLKPDEYQATIGLFRSKHPRCIHTAHFPPMEGESADRFLRESVEFVQELENAIKSVLEGSDIPLTLRQIVEEIYQLFKIWPEEAKWDLAYPISGHLSSMASKGLVKEALVDGRKAWKLVGHHVK